ncbi:MAG: MarR family transcriptional regulator [Herbiconiux sp.]|uniref:MarR family winged helix-turn-helix transcriptional regulator n=1 Tax=Herbiconiux sp. TaxID=1871186 RepID=UPI001217C165|nr:MarR family transcriptional regulator [Herbiconiux sp.]TAJ48506.1 MAG: MarR family transcriptional regulator [Herbiconiux sp.]
MTETPKQTVPVERLRHGDLGDDLSFLLARANALSVSAANTALAAFDLKVRSYSVLALVVGDERPSQRELAEFLRLDPSQVVALVDDLERRGLATRLPDESDRRAKVIVGTTAGRELFAVARRATQRAELEVHSALSAKERELLADTLRRIAYPR